MFFNILGQNLRKICLRDMMVQILRLLNTSAVIFYISHSVKSTDLSHKFYNRNACLGSISAYTNSSTSFRGVLRIVTEVAVVVPILVTYYDFLCRFSAQLRILYIQPLYHIDDIDWYAVVFLSCFIVLMRICSQSQ